MKRGGPLRRKKPLTGTAMTRAKQLTQRTVQRKRAQVTPEEKAAKKGVYKRSSELTGHRLCERCGGRNACEVHHRKNRSQGGGWGLSNLLDLCSECHREVTSLKKVALEQGWSVLREEDPAEKYVWMAGRGYCFLTDTGEINDAKEENDAA